MCRFNASARVLALARRVRADMTPWFVFQGFEMSCHISFSDAYPESSHLSPPEALCGLTVHEVLMEGIGRALRTGVVKGANEARFSAAHAELKVFRVLQQLGRPLILLDVRPLVHRKAQKALDSGDFGTGLL
jgi:hypothetical protein